MVLVVVLVVVLVGGHVVEAVTVDFIVELLVVFGIVETSVNALKSIIVCRP